MVWDKYLACSSKIHSLIAEGYMNLVVLVESICGYICVIPIILLYFVFLKHTNKKQQGMRIIVSFMLCYYLIGILTMTRIGREIKSFEPHLGLIPFIDMIFEPIETILNVILFVPLGLFISLLYDTLNKAKKIVIIGFLLSLSVEIIQMFGLGVTSINDLIANTFGAYVGYCIYKALGKFTPQEFLEKFKSNSINEYGEVTFFIISTFLVMLTIKHPVFNYLFWNLKSLFS